MAILFAVALWAGAQNALAGGGSFVTLPALILSGLDARAANIASTIALFPGQITTGLVGRKMVTGAAGLSFRALVAISLVGGVIGAVLLLTTPSSFFARLVPWLVLFATALFAWSSYFRKAGDGAARLDPRVAGGLQFVIAIYGGYFGGGISILMLAVLTAAGVAVRAAGATKNVLSGVMNASAVAVFLFTPAIPWARVGVVCVGAIIGGFAGAKLLQRVDERLIRGFVILLGLVLTVGLFLRGAKP
ncbi:MAG TPA: sulfite exporter TauE/SafE family protein [Caulobacteraceae bacterium]